MFVFFLYMYVYIYFFSTVIMRLDVKDCGLGFNIGCSFIMPSVRSRDTNCLSSAHLATKPMDNFFFTFPQRWPVFTMCGKMVTS